MTYKSSNNLLNLAYDLSFELNQPTLYDTLYLALAILKSAPFISEDKKFINKAKKYYKNSYSIKQILALI